MSVPALSRDGDTAPGDHLQFLAAYTTHAQAGDTQAAPPGMPATPHPTRRSRTTPMARRGSRWIICGTGRSEGVAGHNAGVGVRPRRAG